MRIGTRILGMVTCGLSLAARAAEPDLGTLLRQLSDNDAALERTLHAADYTRTEQQAEVDAAGHVLHEATRRVRYHHAGPEEQQRLLSAEEDGQDTTAALQPRFAEAQEQYQAALKAHPPKHPERFLPFSSPFAKDEQPRYRFLLLGPAGAPGQVRVHFEPRLEELPGANVGEAVVDVASGALVQLSLEAAKRPMLVQRMSSQVTFGRTPVGPAVTELQAEYDSGWWFAKKRVRTRVVYSDFTRP